MPYCTNCEHSGQDHNVGPRRLNRFGPKCMRSNCQCTKYMPDVPYSEPLNSVIGRIRYKR